MLSNGDIDSSNSHHPHFSLRWNNHPSQLLSAFESLLQDESLVDCTLVCEDGSIKAHRVVLSACSPYFRQIFTDNPCRHPILVLKDVSCWEAQCIIDFMYKGETSVSEDRLGSLLRAAESLRVKGLAGAQEQREAISIKENGYCSPTEPKPDSVSGQSTPISLTTQEQQQLMQCPRRKQARPTRRRSGDSSFSLDSPPNFEFGSGSAGNDEDNAHPENLCVAKRPRSSSSAINLVKTESLLEERPRSTSEVMQQQQQPFSLQQQELLARTPVEHYSVDFARSAHFARAAAAAAAAANMRRAAAAAVAAVGEQDARVEALQALNYMTGNGCVFPHPSAFSKSLLPATVSSSSSSASARDGSSGGSRSAAFAGRGHKGQHSAPRGGPPRSWSNDDLTKALENVWNKRMTTSQASRVFGIPYNSLLMYVRGKYGKSLKLDALKLKTPAANDSLNTIGNSRSTPKEKLAGEKQRLLLGNSSNSNNSSSNNNNNNNSSKSKSMYPNYGAPQQQQQTLAAFPLFQNLPTLQEHMTLLGIRDGSRMRELMQTLQQQQQQQQQQQEQQSALQQDQSLLSRQMMSHDNLLMVATTGNSVGSDARSPVTSEERSLEEEEEDDEMVEKGRRKVRAMLMEAATGGKREEEPVVSPISAV